MKNNIQNIIHLFADSNHDSQLCQEIHQWLTDGKHMDEKEVALSELWEQTTAEADDSTRTSLTKVYQRLDNPVEKSKLSPLRLMSKMWRYAAMIALLLTSVAVTYFLTGTSHIEQAMVQHFTPEGRINTIELPDGSIVQTNSGTLLFYPESFKGDTRTIYLMGEAYFKVKKKPDQPFIVKSGTMAVTALGTEFNVSAYPENDKIVTTLIQGKVKVDCNNESKSYMLAPEQQVVYNTKNKESYMVQSDLADVTAWQRGMYVFRGNTIKEIFSTLERRYAVTFQYNTSSFNDDKYNFGFRENSNLSDIMNVIKTVVGGFTYQIEGDTCYVRKIK